MRKIWNSYQLSHSFSDLSNSLSWCSLLCSHLFLHSLNTSLVLLSDLVELMFLATNELTDFRLTFSKSLCFALAVRWSISSCLFDEVTGTDFDQHVRVVLHDAWHIERRSQGHHDFTSSCSRLHVSQASGRVSEFLRCSEKLLVMLSQLLDLRFDSLLQFYELGRGDFSDIYLLVCICK